jgi:hypothetical protein
MTAVHLLLALILQTVAPLPIPVIQAPPVVVVGLVDGQQLAILNPRFTGFIRSDDNQTMLLYRQKNFHGTMNVLAIQRIDLGYDQRNPFPLKMTLKNGETLYAQSDQLRFLTVTGSTDTGTLTVKHPDPISTVLRISKSWPNRKNDLTIQYLEFPR